MPRDPQHEETSAEDLFKRLRETPEKDLPPIPDVAMPGTPKAPGVPGQSVSEQAVPAKEGTAEERSGEQIEKLVRIAEQMLANQTEFMAEFRAFQDTVEDALGGG